MRGPAAPTSPGPWDPRSEALLQAAVPAALALPVTAAPAEAIQQPAPALGPRAPRRATADPVKALMHRHRELCERAVDPLEIAAGLEAHGVTDRTAARFRHRDVFSLAEELYARVPRGEAPPARPAPAPAAPGGTAAWALAACAPGAVAALATAGLALTEGPLRGAVGALGALGLAAALLVAVRRGPLHAEGRTAPAARLWTLWLLAYAVAGDGLLDQLLTGGPDGAWTLVVPGARTGPADGAWILDTGPLLALSLAVAPAAWCARLFAVRARRRLAASRGLADFAAGVRPLLLSTVALPLVLLAGLLALTGFSPGALALGALLLLARLLTAHGPPEAAAHALAAACAAEALALALVLAARLPGCGFLDAPVRAAVDTWGPAAVPALVCGAAALALLAHATTALSRASAHATAR
ncbi:hypothetical protein [Streptomyces showdoensis]|uniref:Membrane protein n=1 Tax=Streptomyces showdoensis TaxID=68268 RepID=A0A2P2GG22_STREW|nr:hypothetical protein [Streptomyces showdoensis]KKZ70453.1 membrane protein [Streptomyces showdoensis]